MAPGAFIPVHLAWSDVLARFAAALILALALGLERFLHRKPVDFRPFIIISLASCSLTIAIMEVAARANDHQLSIDPAKVMSGIMTGIGFLGAGALFRDKHVVQGAGSAAAIWAAGAIGIVSGFGLLWLAGILGLAVVGTLVISRPFIGDYTDGITPNDDSASGD